jgi:hypothetical protein
MGKGFTDPPEKKIVYRRLTVFMPKILEISDCCKKLLYFINAPFYFVPFPSFEAKIYWLSKSNPDTSR